MSDEELERLLNRWSQQTRLHETEVSKLLDSIISNQFNSAAAWITFWQQIGRLVRVEEQLGDWIRLPPALILTSA